MKMLPIEEAGLVAIFLPLRSESFGDAAILAHHMRRRATVSICAIAISPPFHGRMMKDGPA